MNLLIKGKNMEVTEALRDYIEKKFIKLDKYNSKIMEISIECSVAKNPRIQNNCVVEGTVYVKGGSGVLRGEDSSEDMYAAVDIVIDKLENQLKKHKVKQFDKIPKVKTSVALSENMETDKETDDDEEEYEDEYKEEEQPA